MKVKARLKRVLVSGVDYMIMYSPSQMRGIVTFDCPYCGRNIVHYSTLNFGVDFLDHYEKNRLPRELVYCPRCGNKLNWGGLYAKPLL